MPHRVGGVINVPQWLPWPLTRIGGRLLCPVRIAFARGGGGSLSGRLGLGLGLGVRAHSVGSSLTL